MTTLNISAGEIRVGDIIDGKEVTDFEFQGEFVFIYTDYSQSIISRDTLLKIETDYLDRESDDWGNGEAWEDALEDDIAEMNCGDADNVVESVGDLLDY